MTLPIIGIRLSRENFRDLVAGREIRLTQGLQEISIVLDLDFAGGLRKFSDPPEAREFLKRPHKGQQG